MAKCVACGKFLSSSGAASCSVCPSLYHKACVALPEPSAVSKDWVCPECNTRTRKGDNTPVKLTAQGAPVPQRPVPRAPAAAVSVSPPASAPAFAQVSVSASVLTQQDMHREMAEWMGEVREFRREMVEFRAAFGILSSRMDSIEMRIEVVERAREVSPPEVVDLRSQVELLQRELRDRDQDDLLSDLEIGGLPEHKGENVSHTISVLATKLGVALDERDVVFAERVGMNRSAAAGAEGAPVPRDRRVVVRLVRRCLRDQLLQAARVRRTLTAADAGCASAAESQGRIFLNERLTRANRQLFHRVREECRRLQWRYSWTKRGRIYARQADGRPAYPIRSEADVMRVFGPSLV